MILKKFFSYAFFSVLASAIGFTTSMYLAKVLSPSELGIIGVFQALLYVSIPLVSFSSLGLVPVNKVKMSQIEYQNFSNAYFTLGLLLSLSLMLIAVLLYSFYSEYVWILVAVPIISSIRLFTDFHSAELVQDHHANHYGLYSIIESVFGLTMSVIFISYLSFSWEGRLMALLGASILILVVRYKYDFVTMKLFRFTFNIGEIKKIIFYGWPLMLALGAGWVLNNADRFIVLHYFSLREVGIYTLAFSIGSIVNVVNQATTNAISPTIFQQLHDKTARSILAKYNVFYALFIISIALIGGIGAYWYIPWFFGDKYPQSETVILLVALAFAFNGIYRVTGLVIDFFQATQLKTWLLYISTAIGIVFSVALIPIFGLIAPGIGMVIAYIVLAALSYIYGWKLMCEKGIQ